MAIYAMLATWLAHAPLYFVVLVQLQKFHVCENFPSYCILGGGGRLTITLKIEFVVVSSFLAECEVANTPPTTVNSSTTVDTTVDTTADATVDTTVDATVDTTVDISMYCCAFKCVPLFLISRPNHDESVSIFVG